MDVAELLGQFARVNSEMPLLSIPEITGGLISETIIVYEPQYGALKIDTTLQAILPSISAIDKCALTDAIVDYSSTYLFSPTVDVFQSPQIARNIFKITVRFLSLSVAYSKSLELAQSMLEVDDYSDDVDTYLAAAELLFEAKVFGEEEVFWESLPSKAGPDEWKFFPTATLALLEKWPKAGLDFVLTRASNSVGQAAQELEKFLAFFTDYIAERISQPIFAEAVRGHMRELSQPFKDILSSIGDKRGWTKLPATEPTLPALADDAALAAWEVRSWLMPPRNQQNLQQDWVEVPAAAARYAVISQKGALPLVEISETSPILGVFRAIGSLERRELFGSETNARRAQLEFVRKVVKDDIAACEERDKFDEAERLLEALLRFGKIDDYAQAAAKILFDCGFSNKEIYFLYSEYHQDRLLMKLIVSALRRFKLFSAQTAFRRWDSKSFRIRGEDRDGHVMMTARTANRASPRGIFRYIGFRVFGRIDCLRKLLADATEDGDTRSLGHRLIEIVEHGDNLITKLSLHDRAKLALELGNVGSKGSVFENVRPAIEALAKGRVQNEREVESSNDESLVKFISGEAGVYCGGAINAQLIETWWRASEPENFVELITHEELEQGLTADGVRRYFENQLRFNAISTNTRQATRAQTALTNLTRAIGHDLQGWAKEVNASSKLNGHGPPCDAARRILGPINEPRDGRYAFATTLRDPARLIGSSDRYYNVND